MLFGSLKFTTALAGCTDIIATCLGSKLKLVRLLLSSRFTSLNVLNAAAIRASASVYVLVFNINLLGQLRLNYLCLPGFLLYQNQSLYYQYGLPQLLLSNLRGFILAPQLYGIAICVCVIQVTPIAVNLVSTLVSV